MFATSILFFVAALLPGWRFTKTSCDIGTSFVRSHVAPALSMVLFFNGLGLLVSTVSQNNGLLLHSSSVVLGAWLCIRGINYQLRGDSKLVVQISLSDKNLATIHLRSIRDDFTRETYRELLELLPALRKEGVSQIVMRSPMLRSSKGGQRSIATLNRLVNAQSVEYSEFNLSLISSPLLLLNMYVMKHLFRIPVLRKMNVVSWSEIKILI